MSIQRFEPRTASANAKTTTISADRGAVDDAPVPPVERRRDRYREDEPDTAERAAIA